MNGPITAEEMANELNRLGANLSYNAGMLLASGILAFIQSRAAGVQPPKDAGAVPIPETPIYMLAVDGSHIHFTDGSGSTAEQMIAAVTMNRPGAKCDVRRLYTEQMMTGYGDAREAAGRADAVPVCTCPSGDGSLRHPCQQHPPADPAARAQAGSAGGAAGLLRRCVPYLRDEASKYDDDGSNEPLELVREIESALAHPSPAHAGSGAEALRLDVTGEPKA